MRRSSTAFLGERELKEGDIVGLDFGVSADGYHGDSAVTLPVGKIADEAQKLLDVTQDSLDRGVSAIQTGNRLSDIGHAVQERVEKEEYSVVRTFAGHGIGSKLHEPPWIRTTVRLAGASVVTRDGVGDRADGERRRTGCADVGRRVDGRDRRRFTLRPI